MVFCLGVGFGSLKLALPASGHFVNAQRLPERGFPGCRKWRGEEGEEGDLNAAINLSSAVS